MFFNNFTVFNCSNALTFIRIERKETLNSFKLQILGADPWFLKCWCSTKKKISQYKKIDINHKVSIVARYTIIGMGTRQRHSSQNLKG